MLSLTHPDKNKLSWMSLTHSEKKHRIVMDVTKTYRKKQSIVMDITNTLKA